MAEPQPAASSFDLADEPWLPCLLGSGARAELSVREVLCQAHGIRDLALDQATQYPPVLRMLLAVLHRALRDPGSGIRRDFPLDDDEWEQLHEAGKFPSALVDDYLDRRAAGKFDLFSPEAPFMQAAGLAPASGETKTVALLIPHVASGHNVPLFSGERDQAPPVLSPAEAARWLLHAHAWDTAAIKTGAAGDPSAKLGKTTGNPTGPLGRLGVLIPCGKTLWHTLMFSLLSLHGDVLSPAADLPAWERDPMTAEWSERPADGLLDLYTWPARRIRLVPEQDSGQTVVRQVVLCAGDRVGPGSADRLEPHSAFRPNKQGTGKANANSTQKAQPARLPVIHQPDRRLWRGLGSILPAASGQADPVSYKQALVLQQLGGEARGELLQDTVIRLRAFGITYGNKSAVIDSVYTDELPLPVALLRVRDRLREQAALQAVRAADDAARCLGGLAADISRASGCSDEDLLRATGSKARSELYAQLDTEFPGWITRLPSLTPEDALAAWHSAVRRHAGVIARGITGSAPPSATVGRWVRQPGQGDGQKVWLTAAVAEFRYLSGLRRALSAGETPGSGQEGTAA